MEREAELVSIAWDKLKSFLLLRNASDLIELMKFHLVVAWGAFSCDQADKGSINAGTG